MGRITGPPLEATCGSACPLRAILPADRGQAAFLRTRQAACAGAYLGAPGFASRGVPAARYKSLQASGQMPTIVARPTSARNTGRLSSDTHRAHEDGGQTWAYPGKAHTSPSLRVHVSVPLSAQILAGSERSRGERRMKSWVLVAGLLAAAAASPALAADMDDGKFRIRKAGSMTIRATRRRGRRPTTTTMTMTTTVRVRRRTSSRALRRRTSTPRRRRTSSRALRRRTSTDPRRRTSSPA